MSNNNNDKYIDEHKDDLLKFSELFFKKNYSENKNNDRPKFIIVGTPTFNSSEFEKIYESAREEQKLLKELQKKKKTFKKEFGYVKRKFR